MVSSVKNGCSKVYEPLNEPLVSGTIKNGNVLSYPGDQCNYSPTTMAFVQRLAQIFSIEPRVGLCSRLTDTGPMGSTAALESGATSST